MKPKIWEKEAPDLRNAFRFTVKTRPEIIAKLYKINISEEIFPTL